MICDQRTVAVDDFNVKHRAAVDDYSSSVQERRVASHLHILEARAREGRRVERQGRATSRQWTNGDRAVAVELIRERSSQRIRDFDAACVDKSAKKPWECERFASRRDEPRAEICGGR